MKNLITYFTILISVYGFTQSKTDSIISNLKELTEKNLSFLIKRDSLKTKFGTYKFCEKWNNEVKYLKYNLNKTEIKELEKEKNSSLHIIALLAKLERNNSKAFAKNEINKLLKDEMKFIMVGCYDAITTYSINNYFVYLITKKNIFFKPKFKLSKKELKNINIKIWLVETKFWFKK